MQVRGVFSKIKVVKDRSNQVGKILSRNIKLTLCSCIRVKRNKLQKQPNAALPGANKFYNILNENKRKSYHSFWENVLNIQQFGESQTNQ